MAASQPRDQRAHFAGFVLDFRSGDLWKPDGSRIILPDQPFRILTILVKARGALVARDDLRRELWPDNTFVDFEHSLNAGVKRLRESIGDSASSPRFIETIPRRGYRFIAPVEIVEQPAPTSGGPESAVADTDARRRRRTWVGACIVALAAVVAAVWAGTRAKFHPTPAGGSRLVRLTSDAGLNIDPALSPDGSLVAYASDRQGGTGLDIWVQPVAGGTPWRVTADRGDETEPDFSPDGTLVTYAARERGGIFVVGTAGGKSRLVASGTRARRPRFSPDGKWIAYWTGTPLWDTSPGPPGASGALTIVSATGGSPRVVAADVASARYPVWSPDGTRLLFLGNAVINGQDRGDWFTVPRDGGKAIETGALDVLRSAGVIGPPIPAAWTADGAVVFGVIGEDANVWEVPVSARTGKVSGTPRRLTFGTGHEQDPAASASGAIAFAGVTQNVDVWRIALDPQSGVGRGSFERVTSDAAVDRVMNLSADGERLLFVSSRTNRNEAWLRDLSAGRDTQLTYAGAEAARISRDGSLVAVMRDAPRPIAELMPSAGGQARMLCEACIVLDWSPDGSLMLLGRDNPARIVVRDVESGVETDLAVHPKWNLFQARFSPDGEWVVFHTTNTPSMRQIYAVPARRSAPVPFEQWIPVVTDFGIQPSWSPRGDGVYHFSLRDGFFCAWLQAIDPLTRQPSGPPRAVAHLHQPRLQAVEKAVVTNDVRGGFLYATLTEMTGNIWLMRR